MSTHISNAHQKTTSVREAYRQILRMIHQGNLAPGDRLPIQSELRKILKLGNNTISEAMAQLQADGVLTRAHKAGTTVLDPFATGRRVWTVGILSGDHELIGYFPVLNHFVRKHLVRSGCADQTYVRRGGMETTPSPGFEHYEQLIDDIDAGLVDAVFMNKAIRGDRVLVAGTIDRPNVEAGAVVDETAGGFLAGRRLVERGCKKPTLIEYVNGPAWRGFADALRQGGVDAADRVIHWRIAPGSDGALGREVAQRLLQLPPDQRPDGLAVTADTIAAAMARSFRDAGGDYRPLMVVRTSRQIPLEYELPVIGCEVDLELLARLAVDGLLLHLLKPDAPRTINTVTPSLVE